jgi:protein-S-isoprenylcysteine O-methyltransferase Ste14
MRPRAFPVLGTLLFLVVAPGTIAGLVPLALSEWHQLPAFLGVDSLRWLGVALIVGGIPVLLESFARFALQGLGTPAPIYPTERLIVTGLYRFVRNPMYLGVAAVIFGQALWLGDVRVLVYGAIVCLGFHVFVLAYEEPALRRRYGAQFDDYCRAVRRWLPRVTPWRGASHRSA